LTAGVSNFIATARSPTAISCCAKWRCASASGCPTHHGILSQQLEGMNGIRTLVQCDLSHAMLSHAQGLRVVMDEELLPFADNSADLVVSAGSMHWINDLPGALIQVRRILKPDGLFLAVLPGGETLRELRESLTEAELALYGGVSPRVSPFIDVRDAGSLLQRAGFDMPVSDSELLTVHYADPMQLLYDLRAMGETNAMLAAGKSIPKRELFARAMELYRQRFPAGDGRVAASFELVTLTGWKPK
jgi:NADH dehydrogenase [ubiquinone] 1 alpha subcomplex assembly factor 5